MPRMSAFAADISAKEAKREAGTQVEARDYSLTDWMHWSGKATFS